MSRVAQSCKIVRSYWQPDDRMEEIPVGQELYCASRPLYGHKTWEGAWLHGRHWAIINPNGEYADQFREETVSLDGWRVLFVDMAEAEAWYRMQIRPDDGFTYEDVIEAYGVQHVVDQFQAYWRGKPIMEVLDQERIA